MNEKVIISASRRTDLPAFYTDWLIEVFSKGFADITNPVNRKFFRVSLDQVHSIVVWSKNFGPLIRQIDAFKKYELFFMFTLNAPVTLEPNLPSLEERFRQLDWLSRRFGPERIFIRFDPIVHWKEEGRLKNNLLEFETILKKVAGAGISKVKTSFVNLDYRKLKKRGVDFVSLSLEEKVSLTHSLATRAEKYGLTLQFCCNPYLFSGEVPRNMEKASCIDGRLISSIVGEPVLLKKDPSQRKECLCTYSRDIGDYQQLCPHGCRYCYANPS